MLHLRRYLAALTVLSLLCGTYWLAAAPWIAPPELGSPKPAPAVAPVAISSRAQDDLVRLFPPEAWELGPTTKVVETDQCTLLIQDYLPSPDGLLKLNPCTLIFYAKTSAGRRPIVLQAPAGAELEFDKALDITRASFGRLIGGHLLGEIRIFSPPSQADSRDALLLTTRDVYLDREEIKTDHAVEFQYGDSRGRGRQLKIKLLHAEAGLDGKKQRGALGGIQSLMLSHLEFVRIETAGDGLLGAALAGQKNSAAGAPVEVKCRGAFTFDVPAQVARFEDQVDVQRILPAGPPDKLLCDELLLTFLLKVPAGEAPRLGAKPADPLAGRLQRILALGGPATLEAPSSGVSAKAAWMEFELARRRITLRPDNPQTQPQRVKQVSLRQHEQHFAARELQYELAERGRLGAMWAAGPGEIKLLQGRGAARQPITARWEKELWVRPQDRNQVISLISAASVVAEPLGRFDADELHLWVLEVPAEKPPSAQPPAEQPAEQPADKPRMTLVPDRMLAKGHVSLISPQLDARTSELQAWFMNLPPQPGPEPPPPGGPLREPVAPAGFQQAIIPVGAIPSGPLPSGAIRQVIRPPNVQKFLVVGGKIQMQLAVQGRKFDLEDLTIEGQATIDETRTPEPGQEPIHIAGELLKLRHGTTPQAKVEVSGRPAEVAGRGLWLTAGTIHVHRGENRLWIDGPGEATLPAPPEQSLAMLPAPARGPIAPPPPAAVPVPNVAASKPAQKLHLVWQQDLNFDGSLVRLRGDVQARTQSQTAAAPLLEATLNHRLDFQTPTSRQRPELAKVHLAGGVYLTNRGVNELGEQVSFDQAQIPNLTVDRSAGRLHADGPGWVSTVRRSAGLPGTPPTPGSPAPPPIAPPGSPAAAAGQQPLTSVHIAYSRALEGYLDKRQIEFHGDVRVTYSPAQDFTDRIIVASAADLTERAVLMTCERLVLTEMVTPVQRWVEIQSTGRTILEGRTFTVNTPGRLSYSSATEFVTIEGDGRADAQIFLRSAPGEQVSPQTVRTARYHIRTGEFTGEIKRLEFIVPGKGLKLPGR